MVYLAFDDTDSLRGMCTTFLVTEMVKELDDLDLIGYPRLVRLNPNVPWKTRGNGALCLRIGHGTGTRFEVGEIAGRVIESFASSRENPPTGPILERAAGVLEKWAEFDEDLTNPAVAVLSEKPPQRFYWKAVRDIVAVQDARRIATACGEWKGYKNGRGIVGAVAAAAWRPRDRTYEVLTYRQRNRWGTEREIDAKSVMEMDHKFHETFNNYDYLNRKVTISPGSPCPILFGIRAERPARLKAAMRSIRGEKLERWLIFETNQGTDEHLVRPRGPLRSHTSVILKGEVRNPPRIHPGGHVIFRLGHRGGVDCAAYEPSKQFRRVARALMAGDDVAVCGSVRDEPRTINVEKIQVLKLSHPKVKVSNPSCPRCGKRMKSIGREAGFRCPKCGTRASAKAGIWREAKRSLALGWYEPPVSARRHISKPLRRMGVRANEYPPP